MYKALFPTAVTLNTLFLIFTLFGIFTVFVLINGSIFNSITNIMSGMGSAENGDGKMLAAMATQIPIRNFVQMSMGAFSEGQAKGLLMMLNDDQSSFLGFSRIFWTLGGTLARLPKLLSSI